MVTGSASEGRYVDGEVLVRVPSGRKRTDEARPVDLFEPGLRLAR
jgi:hypothetical protein